MERLIDGGAGCGASTAPLSGRRRFWHEPVSQGPSVAGVALSHGLHPNMVHRWLGQSLSREQVR